MINYLALIVALALSGVSGYYSIIGLTTIFAAAFWPVVVMGTVLEAGKLVTVSWLYRNWKIAPTFLRVYLSLAVVVLMFITSMGIFGYLSRAHIEQSLSITTGDADRLAILESQIENKNSIIVDYDKQLQQIDDALSKITEKGRGESSLQAATQQRKTRNELVAKKNAEVGSLSKLKEEIIGIRSAIRKSEAEVGPLKYIAEALYGEGGNLDNAVRMVIILLVIVFDPLAVVLLIAANHGLAESNKKEEEPEKKELTKKRKRNTIEISDNNILKFT
jgi:hypothetical protein